MIEPVSIRPFLTGSLLLLVAALPADARQAPVSEVVEEVKQLVAIVECRLTDGPRIGAGIVVGASRDTLYIVTADHVVESCRSRPDSVRVRLRTRPDDAIPASLAVEADADLDLALLKVTDEAHAGSLADSLHFDRLGEPESLQRGDFVYSLGSPRGRRWDLSVAAEPVAENTGDRLFYQSTVIGPGHSGGALLDTELLLVGMLRSDQPPNGEAISIARVLDRVRAWGYPVQLVRQSVPEALASIHVGSDHMCGLDADGTAWCWGRSGPWLGTGVQLSGTRTRAGRTRRVVGGLHFRSLTMARSATCGIAESGTALCWGMSPSVPATLAAQSIAYAPRAVDGELRFRALSAGERHVCGVTLQSEAYCWGANDLGQLGDGTGDNSLTPVRVANDLEFTMISAGDAHTCALTADGVAYCWGHNLDGEVGVGGHDVVPLPARVAGDLRFRSLRASPGGHVCGVTLEGDAFCWGDNANGELGNGETGENGDTPTAVAGGLEFAAVTVGNSHSCGLTPTGEAYCWGRNENGELGSDTGAGSAVPVPVAGGHRFTSLDTGPWFGSLTCGLTTDGITYCWGRTDVQEQVGAGFPLDVAVRAPRRIRP